MTEQERETLKRAAGALNEMARLIKHDVDRGRKPKLGSEALGMLTVHDLKGRAHALLRLL